MKLKRNYNVSDLWTLYDNGAIIERDYSTDTFGTSSLGYMERRGITINGKQYQVIYTSKGYGRITSDIVIYNGRCLDKHLQYKYAVNEHFYINVMPYIRGCWLQDRSLRA